MLQGLTSTLIARGNARHDRQLLIEGILLANELPSVKRYSLMTECGSCETCECGEDIQNIGALNMEQKLRSIDIPVDVPAEDKADILYDKLQNDSEPGVASGLHTMTEDRIAQQFNESLQMCEAAYIDACNSGDEAHKATALRHLNAVKSVIAKQR